MTTKNEQTLSRAEQKKARDAQIVVAEANVRNLRDAYQVANDRVREWAVRCQQDPALLNYSVETYESDLDASGAAFTAWSIETIKLARLRLDERADLHNYAQTGGRE